MVKKNNPVIGTQECFSCGATVEIMLCSEGAGNAMYLCDGRADDAYCNDRHHFGGQNTRTMKREAAEAERKPDVTAEKETDIPAIAAGSDTLAEAGTEADDSIGDDDGDDDFI